MSFQGEYINTIDPKGRASIPAKFREILAGTYGDERVVVTKNQEDGLTAYPLPVWAQIRDRVEMSPPGPIKNATVRMFLAPATECAFDKQGRIQIPQALRSYAGLEKEIVVVGLIDKIELHSQVRYAEVSRRSLALLQAEPQVVADFGF